MIITITDDFSLKKIADSGQCFRVREIPADENHGKLYRFICREHILYIEEISSTDYEVNCSQEEWEQVWFPYFDLSTDYAAIRASIPLEDTYLRNAAEVSKGIRILRQDPWEMLITFIISQRKSIPAIKGNVEQLAACFGTPVHTPYEDVYLFPTAEQMVPDACACETLESCRLGYRLPYVEDAIRKVYTGEPDLNDLVNLSDQELFDTLKTVKGVGDKVANCICLFGYHRTANAPVDVWIKRAIDEHYDGINPFPAYGENAGIMQQFLFYYALKNK